MQYFLTVDIISAFHRKAYGHAGDPVKVIADHGNVVMVEDSEGYKFSVLKTEIRDEKDSVPDVTPGPELIPLPPESKSIPTLKETKKKSKGQASLF